MASGRARVSRGAATWVTGWRSKRSVTRKDLRASQTLRSRGRPPIAYLDGVGVPMRSMISCERQMAKSRYSAASSVCHWDSRR